MQIQMLKLGGKGELRCFVGGSFQATARCVAAIFGQGGRSEPLELRLRGFFYLLIRRILDFSAAHQRRLQIKWFRPLSGSGGRCLEVNHGVGGGGPDRVFSDLRGPLRKNKDYVVISVIFLFLDVISSHRYK
jgi:hypothetical protein